jgi:hypothetical protein
MLNVRADARKRFLLENGRGAFIGDLLYAKEDRSMGIPTPQLTSVGQLSRLTAPTR